MRNCFCMSLNIYWNVQICISVLLTIVLLQYSLNCYLPTTLILQGNFICSLLVSVPRYIRLELLSKNISPIFSKAFLFDLSWGILHFASAFFKFWIIPSASCNLINWNSSLLFLRLTYPQLLLLLLREGWSKETFESFYFSTIYTLPNPFVLSKAKHLHTFVIINTLIH